MEIISLVYGVLLWSWKLHNEVNLDAAFRQQQKVLFKLNCDTYRQIAIFYGENLTFILKDHDTISKQTEQNIPYSEIQFSSSATN